MSDSPQFCPECNARTRVVRTMSNAGWVLRVRFCEECGYAFRTKEIFYQTVRPALTPKGAEQRTAGCRAAF